MIIFIYGEDSYSASERLKSMRDRFCEKFDASGMNVVEFGKSKLEIGEVAQAVQSPGFLSPKRMVIVRNLLSQITKKPDAGPWVEQLKKTPEDTIVILFDETSEKKIEKNEIFKQLTKTSGALSYSHPLLSGSALSSWAVNFAKKLNLSITRNQIERIVALVGGDLWQLSSEFEKLAAYASGSPVNDEAIDLLVKANFEDAMFDFVDAVALKQSKLALDLLESQRAAGSTDFHLFAMLARQIRLLIGARDVLDRNPRATKQDVADALGVHPFVAQKTLGQARQFTGERLTWLHGRLYEFDRAAKTGGGDMATFVDLLVAGMIEA